jgi:membrane protein implicated in regulation of membrane protease activity
MVAEGQRSGFGARLASGGVGVAAGVGVTAAAVGGSAGSMAAAAAAASAAVVMLPVVGVAAAWGMAKARKARKERDVKSATALCLSELGYTVDDWKVAKKSKQRPKIASKA